VSFSRSSIYKIIENYLKFAFMSTVSTEIDFSQFVESIVEIAR
jgi:hypothetical protein